MRPKANQLLEAHSLLQKPLSMLSLDFLQDEKVTYLVTKELEISSHGVPGEKKLHYARVQARPVLRRFGPGFCKQH